MFTARILVLHLAPGLLLTGPILVAFFASLVAATAVLILSGVPAALFERVTGRSETDAVSSAIWLATAAAISFPALQRAVAVLL